MDCLFRAICPQPLSTATAPSSCPLPPLSPPLLALSPPPSTIEAAHRRCPVAAHCLRPVTSHSTATVRCHCPQLLCAVTATAIVRIRFCRNATSAALGISSKIGKAHLLFCPPPCYKEMGAGRRGGMTTCTAVLLRFATPPQNLLPIEICTYQ